MITSCASDTVATEVAKALDIDDLTSMTIIIRKLGRYTSILHLL